MSESTETRVGVPGDARLENPNIEKPQSWFAKLPVVRDLKIAVGWQKGMLVTGLVLTGFFLLVAVFVAVLYMSRSSGVSSRGVVGSAGSVFVGSVDAYGGLSGDMVFRCR